MSVRAFSSEPVFIRFTASLRELHRLTRIGQGDSAAADALRDAMDSPFYQLSSEQAEWVAGLSEDLYSLNKDSNSFSPLPIVSPTPMREQVAQMAALKAAHLARDSARELQLLRVLEDHFTPEMVAFQRFSAYFRLGQKETGLLFLDHTVQLAPDNINFQALSLRRHAEVDGSGAVLKRARDYLQSEQTPGALVIAAAGVAFDALDSDTSGESSALLLQIVTALHRVLPLGLDAVGGLRSVLVEGYAIMGFCYRRLGDFRKAVTTFNLGLEVDPQSGALLTARGLTLLVDSPKLAIADLSKAVHLHTPVALPYILLAPVYLEAGLIDEAARLADRGFTLTQEPILKAEALQWLAIVAVERGDLLHAKRLFEDAITLDPLNAQLAENKLEFARIDKFRSDTSNEKRHAEDQNRWQRSAPEAFARFAELWGDALAV
jgi:tetratricopeptide (TPR) repeat protein